MKFCQIWNETSGKARSLWYTTRFVIRKPVPALKRTTVWATRLDVLCSMMLFFFSFFFSYTHLMSNGYMHCVLREMYEAPFKKHTPSAGRFVYSLYVICIYGMVACVCVCDPSQPARWLCTLVVCMCVAHKVCVCEAWSVSQSPQSLLFCYCWDSGHFQAGRIFHPVVLKICFVLKCRCQLWPHWTFPNSTKAYNILYAFKQTVLNLMDNFVNIMRAVCNVGLHNTAGVLSMILIIAFITLNTLCTCQPLSVIKECTR